MVNNNGALGRLLQSKHDRAASAVKKTGNVEIKYGHTGEQVVLIFSAPIENLTLTDEQAEAMIKCMEQSRTDLKERKRRVAAGEPLDIASHG